MQDLSKFQRDCLWAMAQLEGKEENPCGLDIVHHLERKEYKKVYSSRLYTALNELMDKGLVDEKTNEGRSNMYNVTKRGAREISHISKVYDEALKNCNKTEHLHKVEQE